tara:strand:+ start:58022 stop:58462 length:441 start_codon:yes stop_codon:yes gene_type:complete
MQKLLKQRVSISGRTTGTVTLLVCFALLTGCGSETEPTGSVTGNITYQGNPLTEGLVNIYSAGRSVVGTAEIDTEGHFEFAKPIATGDYQVYISPPPPPAPPEPGQPPLKIKPPQKIPQKYRAANTTDLKITITAGANELSLPLTD